MKMNIQSPKYYAPILSSPPISSSQPNHTFSLVYNILISNSKLSKAVIYSEYFE